MWDEGDWLVVEADESDGTFLALVPDIAVTVKPEGGVSVIVTRPASAPRPALRTEIEYWAPTCPCAKLPEWLLAIVSMGGGDAIVVVSDALAGADPPPITLT